MDDRRARGSANRYPPLLAVGALLLLVLAVLPSSLRLPQSNPTRTLEYAPVPPASDEPAPVAGNSSSLALAGSASVASSARSNALNDEPSLSGSAPTPQGRNASTKRCVGNPPRQTEDPLAPPCVGFFTGDNFGATYDGVTRDEVRVLVYVPRGGTGETNDGSRGKLSRPAATYVDLADPPAADEHYYAEAARIWQRYFNDRFQTYGRFVHVFVYYSSLDTIEARRADAADNFNRIKPFAVLFVDANAGNDQPYVEEMARRGVINFGTAGELPARAYAATPRMMWGYSPSIEQHARQFSSYVCARVVHHPVSFGDAQHRGQPRKLALLSTTDGTKPGMVEFARTVRSQITACGGQFVADGTFPTAGYVAGGSFVNAADNMSRFQTAGATTIIWAEGFEQFHSQAATSQNYTPEWIVAGDGVLDDIVLGKYQDQRQWANAWVITNSTLVGPRSREQCFVAASEAQPGFSSRDSSIPCGMYQAFRQLFTGIQVAGPRLGPSSVDEGFRAIPAVASTNPTVPACFYEVDDYTCVKDAVPMWWDAQAISTYSASPGCYRMPEGGRRYLAGRWPDADVLAQKATNDPCNGYTTGTFFDPSPGPDSPDTQ